MTKPVNIHLPDVQQLRAHDEIGRSEIQQLQDALRTTRRNFQRIKEILERNIEDGTITDGATLAGDVTGALDANVVEKVRGAGVDAPTASEDDHLLRYNSTNGDFDWETIEEILDDLLTTSGDLLYRSGSVITRLALGSANFLLAVNSGGTAPTWASFSAMLDAAIGNTHGNVLFRGASAWEVLAPGTAGQLLNTNGAAADPSWEDSPTANPPTDFDLLTAGPVATPSLVFAAGDVIWIT